MSLARSALLRPSTTSALFRAASLQSSRRAASSTTEGAKESAAKAADSAKSYANQASETGSKLIGQASNTASRLLGSYSEPIAYNLSVAREVAKQVYIQEKLAPPTNPEHFRGAYDEFYKKASDASWWRSILESGEWKRIALYAVEAYGIFTIGEMIGRRHIVGYKVEH